MRTERRIYFEIWRDMKRRCYDPRNKSYHNYGARGIVVCSRWLESLDNFIADVGTRPSSEYSLDRINNDGPYSRENVRWATREEQSHNSRRTKPITYMGMTKSHRKWAEYFGICHATLSSRIRRGMALDKAIEKAETPGE